MSDQFLSAYERFSWYAVPRILFAAWRAPTSLRRASMLNRYHDYLNLGRHPELLPLHRALNEQLVASAREWSSYDYGEGYFYQSFPQIGVSGLRDTAARVAAMGLREKLAGRRVLEIGCNSGFLGLSVADVAREVTGFDINPYLVRMACEAAMWLGTDNTRFDVSSFEDFTSDQAYDAVLSFANHHTYDGNTRQDLETYFRKCRDLLPPGGLFLFESHAPDHEGEGLAGVIEIIGRLFTIRERRVLNVGSFLDRGRTFAVAERSA